MSIGAAVMGGPVVSGSAREDPEAVQSGVASAGTNDADPGEAPNAGGGIHLDGGGRRDAGTDTREDVSHERDRVAHGRDIDAEQRDVNAGRSDASATVRDHVADERDVGGNQRDADAEMRDASAAHRDTTGDRRDDTAVTRDLAAEVRDEVAAQRDDRADQRDRAAEQRDRGIEGRDSTAPHDAAFLAGLEALELWLDLAAADRGLAREDRAAAADQRIKAASDRAISLADRVAGAERRQGSRMNRGTALADRVAGSGDRDYSRLDRGTSLADRVAGASDRDWSSLDRGTSLDDRAASGVDRSWSAADEQQKAERFNEFASNVDIGFLVYDRADHIFEYLNPAFYSIFALDTDTVVDPSTVRGLAHPDDRERLLPYLDAGPVGDLVENESRIILPGGEVRWVRATVFGLADEDGKGHRIGSTIEDISDRKAAEAELIDARREAERASASKDEFLSRLSHELRTPLNAVLGFAQLLELDTLGPKQDGFVEHILRGGRHLLAMIDDILDITAIDAGRLNLEPQNLGIGELVEDLLGLMQPMATANHIALRFDPGRAAASRVTADPHRLRQVLLNLVSNAIKYNRPGGTVDVCVDINVDADTISIAVIDTGLGIPAGDLPRLFTAFDRLGRESTGIEGTGIGLTLSQRLVTLMGGRLDVETATGLGSTLTVTLPGAPQPTGDDHGMSKPGVFARVEPNQLSSLLYIEDNSSNRELMSNVLAIRPQWNLTHATTGKEGLERARAHPPTAILLDLHLPDIDGMDILHLLKSAPGTSHIPVAMLSADANPSQITQLLSAGADHYLTKPLEITALFDFLDSTTDRHHA